MSALGQPVGFAAGEQGGQGRPQAARRGSLDGPVSVARDTGWPSPSGLDGRLAVVFTGGARARKACERGSTDIVAGRLAEETGCR